MKTKIILKIINFLLILMAVVLSGGCNLNPQKDSNLNPEESRRIALSASALKPGDTFTFGQYEQDNDPENGPEPVEWQVLAVENGRLLLISRYALDAKAYNEPFLFATWQRSTLRKWLNGDFYDTAFSPAEKGIIAEVKNDNPMNPSAGTRGGGATKDRIFLLNIDEAARYFPDDEARQCEATEYTKAKGAYISDNGNSWWWLRSPGRSGSAAAIVLDVGYVTHLGYAVNDTFNTVRPAFWLEL